LVGFPPAAVRHFAVMGITAALAFAPLSSGGYHLGNRFHWIPR
jgi:hypothetical protein